VLFSKNPESFQLKDSQGKTPTFKLFSDSMSKKALALAINSYFKLDSSDKSSVQARFEKMTLKALKNGKVDLSLQLSGKIFDLEASPNKDDVVSGKTIQVKIPTENHDVGVFSVNTKGQFKMRFSPNENKLYLENVEGHFRFDNPLGEEESEDLKFSAVGIRD
jgi:hypothetical protein